MKRLFFAMLLSVLISASLGAQSTVYVSGYARADGTYVPAHYRTAPNSTKLDNYSTKGNYNPYTGDEGTKDPYAFRCGTWLRYIGAPRGVSPAHSCARSSGAGSPRSR